MSTIGRAVADVVKISDRGGDCRLFRYRVKEWRNEKENITFDKKSGRHDVGLFQITHERICVFDGT